MAANRLAHSNGSPVRHGPRRARAPQSGIDAAAVAGAPASGEPGHGTTASLRRQPLRIVEGRVEGGYTERFEFICPDCGDHPYLDYSEVPHRLQLLRGPRTMNEGLAAYEKHLGLR